MARALLFVFVFITIQVSAGFSQAVESPQNLFSKLHRVTSAGIQSGQLTYCQACSKSVREFGYQIWGDQNHQDKTFISFLSAHNWLLSDSPLSNFEQNALLRIENSLENIQKTSSCVDSQVLDVTIAISQLGLDIIAEALSQPQPREVEDLLEQSVFNFSEMKAEALRLKDQNSVATP